MNWSAHFLVVMALAESMDAADTCETVIIFFLNKCVFEEEESAGPHNLFNSFPRPYGYMLANTKQTHFSGEKSATFSVCFL